MTHCKGKQETQESNR